MRRRNFLGAAVWVAALGKNGWERLGSLGRAAVARQKPAESQRGKTWAAFELAELNTKREATGRPYLEFVRAPTLSSGIYVLQANAEDRQPVHKEDELYYVAGGRAVLRIGEEDQPVQPGSIIYVKAGIAHRFHSIREELKILVFFSTAPPGDGLKSD